MLIVLQGLTFESFGLSVTVPVNAYELLVIKVWQWLSKWLMGKGISKLTIMNEI